MNFNSAASQAGQTINRGFGAVNSFFENKKKQHEEEGKAGKLFQETRRAFQDACSFSDMALAPKNDKGFALGKHNEVINWRNPSSLSFSKDVAEGEFGQPIKRDSIEKFHQSALAFAEAIDQGPLDQNPEPGLVEYTQEPNFSYRETGHNETYNLAVDLGEQTATVIDFKTVGLFSSQENGRSLTSATMDDGEIGAAFIEQHGESVVQQGTL